MPEGFEPLSNEQTLPAVYAGHLVELVGRWAVGREQLLETLDIAPEMLADPHARLPLASFQRLAERAVQLTGEPGLGIYLGLATRISWHGHLGFAAMTAGTVREALDIATRFMPTRTTALSLRLHEEEEGKVASLVLEEHAPLGTARELLVFALSIGISRVGSALTGRELQGRADFAFPEPEYFSRLGHVLTAQVEFDQPSHRIIFDSSVLDFPLQMADPAAMRLATEQCERELLALGFQARIGGRVRALLARDEGGFRSLEEVAQQLHLSERTLKRKLAQDGTSYSALLEDERHQRALLLLQSDTLSMEQVAERLGYADAAAFTRAFTRWTGQAPGAFRRKAGERSRRG